MIVVLKNQHSNLNLIKQAALRIAAAHRDQAPIIASIKAHGGSDILQLVAVNAVAAKLPAAEVTRLIGLSSVAKIVPDATLTSQFALTTPAASVPGSQVVPPANPAPCPANATAPTGATDAAQEPEADASVHASTGNPNSPDEGNLVKTGSSNAPADGAGVTIANNNVNNMAGNPNFIRPNGQEISVDVPVGSTNLNQGNDEYDEDVSSMAAQGTVEYQYDSHTGTGNMQGALPFSNLPASCKFYILGSAPGASVVDITQLDVPHSLNQTLESAAIAGIDHVTDAAQPAWHADEISESYGSNPAVPQIIETGNDAAVAAGVAVFVSSGDSGDSQQGGTTLNPLSDDGFVMALGATDGNRLYALNDGFQSYRSDEMAAISSGGVGSRGRVVDVVAPGWFGGEGACPCTAWNPTEAMRGTSESAPLSAGGGADVIEAYRNTHGGTTPTPALLKSLLDGTATDIDSPSDMQGSGELNVYRAVEAAMQMPGTSDPTGPPADARELVPTPSQVDVSGAAGTTTTQSVTLYNTNTAPTTVTGTFRTMGPQFNIAPTVTEPVSAPPFGTPVPPQGATAAAPISFTVPAGLDRLELSYITPDPTNNTMLQILLFDPSGKFVQDSYDDGTTSQGVTSLSAATTVGTSNIKVASVSSAVVGNKVQIDTLAGEETDTVAAIGRPSTSTTLTAATAAGATNIKVATDTNIGVGDKLTIDAGGVQETATVATVGTATTNTTINAATVVGATNVRVSSATTAANFHAGDSVTIDSGTNAETDTVASVSGTTINLTTAMARVHNSGAALQDLGTGLTLTAGLLNPHAAGATVFDAGTGVTLSTPLAQAHAAGAQVVFSGTGREPNYQEIEVAAPAAGTWTAQIVWNGIDQDVAAAPPLPGSYTGNMSFQIQGSQWQYSPATAPVNIPAHSSATIPFNYQFPGAPGDYPQSIQFSADDGGTTSVPFIPRSIIPTGFNIPFTFNVTSSVGRGNSQFNQFFVNVPPNSASITVNLSTPDTSTDQTWTYYVANTTTTSGSCATAPATSTFCQRITEPQTVNGVTSTNGTVTIPNPAPGLYQIDVNLGTTESGKEFSQLVSGTVTVVPETTVGGNVPSTLGITIPSGTAPSLGTFTPGVAQTYSQTVAATVTSTAQSATLGATDACTPIGSCAPGHLINTSTGGPYALAQGLQVGASDPAGTPGSGTFTDLSLTNPATLLSYGGPVSNDPVTITFKQPIGPTDPLRTGAYSKTITFTLSTNSP